MATIYYEQDADLTRIQDRRVAVLGYGSQGHAHALNLRDSGVDVRVGLRPDSSSRTDAQEQGLRVLDPAEAASEADVVVVLVPDTHHKALWEDGVAQAMEPGDLLVFGHGFNIHFGFVEPVEGIDVVLIAPKSPGHMVRRLYVEGQGTPGLVAVHQDATGEALPLALSYGGALGLARAGLLETTFAEETETDLFGEQAVLCGGMSQLVQRGFEVLTEAGYQPEVAYFECLHEMKLIVDMMYEGGLSWMRHSISTTAEYGDYVSGPRIVDESVTESMREVLSDITDGSFARRFMQQYEDGGDEYARLRREARGAPIEEVGHQLREMMPWISNPTTAD